MKINLRTAFGVSTTFYTSDVEPFQGEGQGNRESPEIDFIISIFINWYFYQQKVVASVTTPISKLFKLLAALLYVDDTDLYVFNSGSDNNQDIVSKGKSLLHAWYEVLKVTGGDLKLAKCYWTLQAYSWQDRLCTCNTSTSSTISIANNNLNTKIMDVPTNKIRTLVGILVIPSNDYHEVDLCYQNKIKECTFRVQNTTLSPKTFFFGYERHWLPSLTFESPVFTITHKGSILAPLHQALFPRLKSIGTFPLVMQSAPTEIGKLNLRPLEIHLEINPFTI